MDYLIQGMEFTKSHLSVIVRCIAYSTFQGNVHIFMIAELTLYFSFECVS